MQQKYHQLFQIELRGLNDKENNEVQLWHEEIKFTRFFLQMTSETMEAIVKDDLLGAVSIIEKLFFMFPNFAMPNGNCLLPKIKTVSAVLGLHLCN